jgi:hypothetical protein
MKNDVVALEYPINHFISQCIRNGQWPCWFNSWGMGFPLQSNITWSVFSTPQMLFSSLSNYNIYALHAEFMFFILLSGCSMFYFMRRFIVKDDKLARLLAVAYMLSGFMVGSTQWLLYITAAAFIPLLLSCIFSLLERPTARHAFLTAVVYSMMFTSVYAALNIITTYALLAFLFIFLIRSYKSGATFKKVLGYLSLSAVITAILCLPVVYFSLEVLNNIQRGSAITNDPSFFNSNYLHPAALSTMLLPFSSVKMMFSNTEGTMLDSYAGLITIIALPAAIIAWYRKRSVISLSLFLATITFLLLSFGAFTPVRHAFNLLPGFSYFRNPAIFRFYFILCLLLFIAYTLRNWSLQEILSYSSSRLVYYLMAAICIFIIVFHIRDFNLTGVRSASSFIKGMSSSTALLIAAVVQLIIVLLLGILLYRMLFKAARILLLADLVINTLLCTPFFSVSSYSLPEVNNILSTTKGFPVQEPPPSSVNSIYTDVHGNAWQNVNVFSKEVSSQESYLGPLVLKENIMEYSPAGKALVYAANPSNDKGIRITEQLPSRVRALSDLPVSDTIIFQQNYFKGWRAAINGAPVPLIISGRQIRLAVPAGRSEIEFRYSRPDVKFAAIFIHAFTLITLLSAVFFKANSSRSRD